MKLLCLAFFLLSLPLVFADDLRVGFYKPSCPQAESVVQGVVVKHFGTDQSITAALLRMYFHDCFVHGCDGSILIDSTSTNPSEKDALPNLTVRGFDIIDEAKAILEDQCPSSVSCADIIALATRDAVALSGGPKYDIPTGRRDGLSSNPNDVDLPGPSMTVSEAYQFFYDKDFTLEEMVILLGCHTVGVAHCSLFRDRLRNFQGTGAADPTMDCKLRENLTKLCASGPDPVAFLDQGTAFRVDNSYYNQLLQRKGIMQIDQELVSQIMTLPSVIGFALDNDAFLGKLKYALVKLGSVEVLTGEEGEIRTKCGAFNKKST